MANGARNDQLEAFDRLAQDLLPAALRGEVRPLRGLPPPLQAKDVQALLVSCRETRKGKGQEVVKESCSNCAHYCPRMTYYGTCSVDRKDAATQAWSLCGRWRKRT